MIFKKDDLILTASGLYRVSSLETIDDKIHFIFESDKIYTSNDYDIKGVLSTNDDSKFTIEKLYKINDNSTTGMFTEIVRVAQENDEKNGNNSSKLLPDIDTKLAAEFLLSPIKVITSDSHIDVKMTKVSTGDINIESY